MKKLLITDTFFVTQPYVDQLTAAGYDVIRLDKVKPSEDELITALNGVSVYIIGGGEQVTDRVLAATDTLETIIFTGVDYSKFVPGEATAIEKGIAILNAPGANAVAVAEFAVSVALAMQREIFTISRNGTVRSSTTRSMQNATIGIVGMGNIGSVICKAIQPYQPKHITYYNRSAKDTVAERVSLDELVVGADIIFLTLPASAGQVFDATLISKLKPDALLISISPNILIDYDALLLRLQKGELRAAIDWPSPNPAFDELPLNSWLSFNSHSAYNTYEALDKVNASVTKTAISLLDI